MPITFNYSRGFLKDVRKLRKRFRLIEDDIELLKEEMRNSQYRGVLVPYWGPNVYKVRLANRSARRGKSGGFRVIYLHKSEDSFRFLHIYSKFDKDDVSEVDIRRMLRDES